MEQSGWLDYNTRAVFLEFNVWNANTNLFNMVTLLVEFSTSGYSTFSHTIETARLYRYHGAGGVLALLSEIACVIFIIVMAVLETRKMIQKRASYFRSVYNITQLLIVLLFAVSIVLYIYRSLWTIWTVEELMNNRGKAIIQRKKIRIVVIRVAAPPAAAAAERAATTAAAAVVVVAAAAAVEVVVVVVVVAVVAVAAVVVVVVVVAAAAAAAVVVVAIAVVVGCVLLTNI